jgi:predicted amidophosphoribosyltransferase
MVYTADESGDDTSPMRDPYSSASDNEDTTTCPSCENEVPKNVNFCPTCGEQLTE